VVVEKGDAHGCQGYVTSGNNGPRVRRGARRGSRTRP
jgi:hypothetical protein